MVVAKILLCLIKLNGVYLFYILRTLLFKSFKKKKKLFYLFIIYLYTYFIYLVIVFYLKIQFIVFSKFNIFKKPLSL